MSHASPLPFAATGLPVESVLPELLSALEDAGMAVLSAEPGAGKTTLVPPALLGQPWLGGRKILMLQPRRVAAQTSARRIAELMGEKVGETVGYRIALDSKVSSRTRIEIITEGILTRMIQDDPELPGIGAVIFDEFHERSLHADLGLAFALEVRESLRPDLRILVMSATIDTAALVRTMGSHGDATAGNAGLSRVPVVKSEGRSFPVESAYAAPPAGSDYWKSPRGFLDFAARSVASLDTDGDVLVFMPGRREVRDLEARLRVSMAAEIAAGLDIATLSGDMDSASQAALIRDRSAKRRIIIATSLAETSVTIPGISVVVDSGLARFNRLDPRTGMDRLVTEQVSLASSIQRQGRAGRLGPGFCLKLWDPQERLPAYLPPEIERGDLAAFLLEAAAWGKRHAGELRLLSPAGAGSLAQARGLLQELGALEAGGGGDSIPAITAHGRTMAGAGTHPRAAHVLAATGNENGGRAVAAAVCAVLVEESDALWGRGEVDADSLVREMARGSLPEFDRARLKLRRFLGSKGDRGLASGAGSDNRYDIENAAPYVPGCFAMAFPDRLAHLKERTKDGAVYLLSSGRMAKTVSATSVAEWLVVIDADAGIDTARIRSSFPLSVEDVTGLTRDLSPRSEIEWDGLRPKSYVRKAIGKIVFEERVQALSQVDKAVVCESFREVLAAKGLDVLPWSDKSESLLRRLRYATHAGTRFPPEMRPFPAFDTASLIGSAETWLFPNLATTGGAVLDTESLLRALEQTLDWKQLQWFERELPTRLQTPAGSMRPVDYPVIPDDAAIDAPLPAPYFSARIQEIFGMTSQPRVLGRPVQLHLLSPANRPLQITEDLESFWKNTYPEVRKEMRGRYPRHYWPENPLEAEPTSRAKPRGT